MPDTETTEPPLGIDRNPTLEEYVTGLLDTIGAPAEVDGVALTLHQRHARMMGRYAEIISQHHVALLEAEKSQRRLLADVRRAQRFLKRGEITKATERLVQITTLAIAAKALKA